MTDGTTEIDLQESSKTGPLLADEIARQVSVIIPAYNEAEAITGVINSLVESMPLAEIIVVDDGSTDETWSNAAVADTVKVLRHRFNRGYGAALKTGMRAATREVVVWFDADNEHRVDDLAAMVQLLFDEHLAAVLSTRRNPSFSIVRSLGKMVIRTTARTLDFRAGSDLNSGLRAFRREAITPYLNLLPDGYSASLTSTMVMIERGYPVTFRSIELEPRIGESKVKLRDGFQALLTVLRLTMLFAPIRIFFRFGGLLVLIGITYSIVVALTERTGVPVAGLLVFLSGLLLMVLGLVADQISQMRLAAFTPAEEAGGWTSATRQPFGVAKLTADEAPEEDVTTRPS